MSPNPFTAIKLLVSPHKWLVTRPADPRPESKPEHWGKSPKVTIPGHYEHRPGRGWYLLAVDNAEDCALRLPQRVTYCKILHRWMLVCDFEKRRRQETIKHSSYLNGQPKLRGFFLLDDERTYVMAWNSTGEFILPSGRVQGWCIDENTRTLRPMERKDQTSQSTTIIDGISVGGSSGTPSVKWTESRNASVASGTQGCGHACVSCNASKPASIFTAGSKNGTALTTPGSPAVVSSDEDEVNAKELRVKLKELYDNQPRVISS